MATLKQYPHYEINVRDNSIYSVTYDEILPVHCALWVLPTEKGPAGEPVFCDSTKLMKVFGSQTLKETSKYFSRQAFYLKNTLALNGAFIVRAVDSNASNAAIVLEAVVTDADVVQYEVDEDPNSDTYGQRLVDLDTESPTYGEYIKKTTSETVVTTTQVPYLIDGEYVKLVADSTSKLPGATGYTATFKVLGEDSNQVQPGGIGYIETWVDSVVLPNSTPGASLTYQTSADAPGIGAEWAIYTIAQSTSEEVETEVTEPGVQITWRTRIPTAGEIDEGLDNLAPETNGDITVYPVLAFEALYPGEYGNNLGFRFFYNKKDNDPSTIKYFGSVFNSISVIDRDVTSGTSEIQRDRFSRGINVVAANPDAIDKETAVKYDMASVLSKAFPDDNYLLPYTIYTFEESIAAIGKRVLEVETAESLCAELIGGNVEGVDDDYVEEIDDIALSGYHVNILTGVNARGVPYDHVAIKGRVAGDELAATSTTSETLLDANIDLFLTEGDDGNSIDAEFSDQAMYRFCKLYMNPHVIDKARYPFTHMIDPGYSMTTKFAMIDFINVRDDIAIDLATQVLFPNSWATGVSRPLTLNDMGTDITNGIILRERALLMRESTKHNTDCCRINIFMHSGYPIAATYSEPCPFTLWMAVERARYGNRTAMSIGEPQGTPYSYNNMFKRGSWNWIMYDDNQKDAAWSSGLNYCQYADSQRIFYPALRSVYPHDTSALVDISAVDAVVYTKHVCRKTWVKFSGRNERTSVKQAAIKTYLEAGLSSLYNGKYDFSVSVYQTADGLNQRIQSVRIGIVFPNTDRVLDFDIDINREGFNTEETA